jgi:hypothetical protein
VLEHCVEIISYERRLLVCWQDRAYREDEPGGSAVDDEPQETGEPSEPGGAGERSEELPSIRAEEERGGDKGQRGEHCRLDPEEFAEGA